MNATFSGESACHSGAGWCSVRVLVDGTEANPSVTGGGAAVFEAAFDSTDGDTETAASWEMHSIQRSSDELGPGTYDVTVQWGVWAPATFWIDDWQFTAEVKLTS